MDRCGSSSNPILSLHMNEGTEESDKVLDAEYDGMRPTRQGVCYTNM